MRNRFKDYEEPISCKLEPDYENKMAISYCIVCTRFLPVVSRIGGLQASSENTYYH